MTTPYIIKSITIENAGGGSPLTYDTIVVETRAIGIDYEAIQVDQAMEMASSRKVSVSLDTYDLSILSDSRITQNASSIASPARITLNGESGSVSIMIESIRLRLCPKIGNRQCFTITGTKSASMMTSSQWFEYRVGLDGGVISSIRELSILNGNGAGLVCPCNSGKEGFLYFFTQPEFALITFT